MSIATNEILSSIKTFIGINELIEKYGIEPEWPSGLKVELVEFREKLAVAIELFARVLKALEEVNKVQPEYAQYILRICVGTIEAFINEVESHSGDLHISNQVNNSGDTLEGMLLDIIAVLSGAEAELKSGIASTIFALIEQLDTMKQTNL